MYPPKLKFFLVRSGRDAGTHAERLSNERLTLQGTAEATSIGNLLLNKNLTKFFSSPAKRATETSDIISKLVDKTYLVKQRLKDRDLGQAADLDYKEVEKRFGSILKENRFHKNWKFPGGESNLKIFMRANSLIKEIEELATGISEQILIVSHPVVLNYLIYSMQRLSFQEGLFFRFEPGMIAEMQREGNYYHLHSFVKPNPEEIVID